MTPFLRIIPVLLLGLFLSGCAPTEPQKPSVSPHVGLWKLVSSQNERGETVPADQDFYKMLTKTHWVWFGQNPDSVRAYLSKGTERDTLISYLIDSHGFGSYTFTDSTYSKTLLQFRGAGTTYPLGLSFTFRSRFEGNKWYHDCDSFPDYDRDGKPRGSFVLSEVWERVE